VVLCYYGGCDECYLLPTIVIRSFSSFTGCNNLELPKKKRLVTMKALLMGFFGVFAGFLALGFLIQNPAVFWVILFVLIAAFVIGVFMGRKKTVLDDAERMRRRDAALGRIGGISEGDIVHHHQTNGRPFDERENNSSILGAVAAGAAAAYILKPDAEPTAPIVEPDPEIENAAAMYYEGNDSYNEEEGEY
jgi:hypothetical protein